MSRKLIIIGLIVLTAAAISYFLYTNRRTAAPQEAVPLITEETPRAVELLPSAEVATPETETNALHLVAPLQILDYWLDSGDRTIYLATSDGTVYTVAPDGGEPVQVFRIPGMASSSIVTIKSNKNTAAALVEYRSVDNKKAFSVIDPILNTTRFLPIGTNAAAWSPNGKEIVYLQDKMNSKDLATTLFNYNPATNISKKLSSFEVLDPVLTWLESGDIVINTQATDSSEGVEWRYNLKNKTLTQSGTPVRGLTTLWNKNGSLGLRYTANISPNIDIVNAAGKTIMSWSRPTSPEKCFIESTAILCATPTDSFLPSRFRDNYLQRALYTKDNLVITPIRNNTPARDQTTTTSFSENTETVVDAYRLEKINNSLYFINRYTQQLYVLGLN